jgi:hypothetical protein
MPTENENKKPSEDLIDVGETVGADINLDDKGEPEKVEAPVEEKIEVEQVPEDKTYENEKQVKLKKEKPEDELQDYSDSVQKRISKLTRKMREAERQREEAVQFAQAAKMDKDRLEKKLSTLDQSYVNEFESRVTTNMDAARQSLKASIEAGDVDGQVAAQEQIAKLAQDASRLGALKKLNEEQPKKRVVEQPYQAPTPRRAQSDPKAEDWASKNTWFGSDSAMTHTAFDLHKKLVEEEGYDPQSDEYYKEVDSRIRLEFPHKFDKIDGTTTERAKPAQNVASARRSSSTTGRKKTVRLSPSQVAIAKRLGVPLEDYAKQLNITEGV